MLSQKANSTWNESTSKTNFPLVNVGKVEIGARRCIFTANDCFTAGIYSADTLLTFRG